MWLPTRGRAGDLDLPVDLGPVAAQDDIMDTDGSPVEPDTYTHGVHNRQQRFQSLNQASLCVGCTHQPPAREQSVC
jgi:hypothetical protein